MMHHALSIEAYPRQAYAIDRSSVAKPYWLPSSTFLRSVCKWVSPVTSLVMITMIPIGQMCCLYYDQNKHSSQYSTVVEQPLKHSNVNVTKVDI